MKNILGKKQGMTRVFTDEGFVQPVSVIEAGPCVVTQVKTEQRHGYQAVQLGYGEDNKLNGPESGHLKRSSSVRHLKEFRVDDLGDAQVGQKIGVDIFQPGDFVDVIGVSKGKGFAGSMKRHHFAGGPKTHGQREHPRSAGSIGQASDPSRVFKGMKMAGQYGNKRMTVRNLEVVSVDSEKNQILLKGAVPGAKNGIIFISK